MKLYNIDNFEDRQIGKVLSAQARDNADQVWLWSDDQKITFREADQLVNQYANGFIERGLKKGDTVAMVMKPSADVVLLAVAAARMGAIFQTISTDFRGDFLREAVLNSHASILVVDEEFEDRIDVVPTPPLGIFKKTESDRPSALPCLSNLSSRNADDPGVEVSWSDIVQVWWSSGTTGKPKGIMHSHSSVLFGNMITARRLQPGDVLYSCTPVYLGSAWVGAVWPSLLGGVTAAIDPSFSASRFWDRVRSCGATHFLTLGAMHMYLWQTPQSPSDRDHRVREARCIPLGQDMVAKFKERFGIAYMPQVYGTSETYTVFSAPEDGTKWTGNAAGRPVPHYEVKLFDEFDREVAQGAVGEICVRPKGPGILFSGYFNAPDVTVSAWRNLWHHTGDMAYVDEAGVYYFADRKTDYIRHKGRNISMFEVETVVARHPSVENSAAYGVQSAELESESELMLSVVPKPGRTIEPLELAKFINRNAPYYFVPQYIEIVDRLPQNAHGRVMKNELKERGRTDSSWKLEGSGYKPVR